MNIRFTIVLALTVLFSGLWGCKNKPAEVDQSFSRYIAGYTSGQISTKGTIQIELAEDQPHVALYTEVKDKLFTFSPAVKGKAYWKSSRLIEFIPDAPLKENTQYFVSFNLGKLMPELDKKYHTFGITVYTMEQNFSFAEVFYQPVHDNQNRWNTMEVGFSVADALTEEEAKAIFMAELEGNKLSPRLMSSANGLSFRFLLDSIERVTEDQNLRLICNGKAIGSKKIVEKDVLIHAIDKFEVIRTQTFSDPERCIKIFFTDPLGKQDLKGLIELTDVENYTFKTNKNVVSVFSEARFPENVQGLISKDIKNFAGKTLGTDFVFNKIIAPELPVVRLLRSGSIFPDSKNLILPFSAVNVSAVELRIIKIFEQNILSFLQDNSMDGSDNLTRSGRLIAKKILRLDQDKSKILTNWNNYAIDISALVGKDPGAIYRFELIIRQEFSLYPCGNNAPSPTESQLSLFDENNFTLTEEDLADFNTPYGYYNPIRYDWRAYDWRQRDNPCHPTFYMQERNVLVSCNLFASNIGIIAKKGEGSEMLIATQDIRTTEPLNGSKVRVLNFQLMPIATGTTDKNGFCILQVRQNEAFIVEVTHGNQKGYLKVNNGNELSLSRFDVSGKTIQRGLKGFIYGERGIWRPGDEIFMTFILEDRRKTIPEGHPVTMEVFNPQGQFNRRLVQTQPVGNFYTFQFKTEEQAPTGVWRAVVSVGGAKFEKYFRIETIKPNRLKINVNFGTEIITQQNLTVALDVKWLHGAVARDLRTRIFLKLNQTTTRFKGYEAYHFTNPATEVFSYEEQIYSGRLDANGQASINLKMPKAETAAGMLTATFTTSVEESGGGESITINSLPYSPFPAYVGLNVHQESEYDVLETGKTHHFDVVLLDAKGNPVPSGELIYKAYRLSWSWWWDEDENRNRLSSVVNGNHIKPFIDQKISIKDGKARIAFQATSEEWGRYLIFIKDPKGGHATGKQIFVDDPYWGGRSRQDDPQGIAMLTFTTDKRSYNVGEEVQITLGKGGNGRALVSLENGSQSLKQWWVETKHQEPTVIKFKVTEDLAPNFYVHITLLQHHNQMVNDLPIRMYGVVPVMVVNPKGELKPTISMPDILRTEKEFSIVIGEANKQEMTYTLAIVDEGLLDINNFKTPNPYAEFNAREALGVRTFDLYNQVIGAFSGELKPLFSVGGGDDINPDKRKSQRFKPVVRFLGPFELQKGKTSKHTLKLPPYIGSVRVMVVAGNANNAYGKAEKTVPVQSPLMILTTLPRVLGPNEEVWMPVNLFVTDKSINKVNIEVKSCDLMQLQEGSSKTVTINATGDQLVFFKLKTKKQMGKAQITVTATSGKEISTETIDIEIRNPNPALTIFDFFVVPPGEIQEIDYEFDEELSDNQVKLEYARIPSVNLNSSLRFLTGYPHGCAEQIISKAFPQLFLHHFVALSSEQKKNIQESVNAVIKQLYAMQTSEGGISYWSGSSQADEWVTSYAGHFMACARDQGYNILQPFVNEWQRYQRSRINNWNSGNYKDVLLQTYRLYSLAMMGVPDLASMNKLKERDNLPLQAKWQLAATYAICGKKEVAREIVNNLKTQVESFSAFNSNFGSSVRDEAIILEACILLDDMSQALTIARRISNYLNGNNFSTQATAWSLMAMARFAEKSGTGDLQFTTSYLGKNTKIQTRDPIYVEELSPVKKSGKVHVTNTGNGNLYLGRTMVTTPLEDRSPAVNNNLRISVEYEDLGNVPLNVAQLRQGTDFIIHVKVTNISGSTTYTNLALTHILPSGWEIFNTRLGNEVGSSNSSAEAKPQPNYQPNGAGITYQDIRDDRVLSYFDLPPGQSKTVIVRVQAAYPGRFFMPAVACQAMYDHTVYARTKGNWVEVVK
ncbi:MAG: MG2 domain-containing protein [Lentimicrobiaceae bacterium]|nr:MG2 domain-containing protein [Lentimicrobiaceae bacterium]